MKIIRQKERFGQNFLKDEYMLSKIVKTLAPLENESILEIGPGGGALTQHLAHLPIKLSVLEIDFHWAEALEARFQGLNIFREDALRFDYQKLKTPISIVGNLPYNVGPKIILRILKSRLSFRKMAFMLDGAVAKKLCTKAANPEYGRLAAAIFPYADAHFSFKVPSSSFHPAPQEDSGFFTLTPKKTPDICLQCYQILIDQAFMHRRKMLRHHLKSLFDFENSSISKLSTMRAEALSIDDWLILTRNMNCPHHYSYESH